MLALPHKIERSVKNHNSKREVFFDWIEASLLFDDDELSQSDVVDVLIEQQIYDYGNEDFCSQFVAEAWTELRRRLRWLGQGSPLEFFGTRMTRRRNWLEVPAHSFCVLLGLTPYFDSIAHKFGADYQEQGAIFEKLTAEAVSSIFKGWQVIRTGWSSDRASNLSVVLPDLASKLRESPGNFEKYASQNAKESGLDLAWHWYFLDGRGGHPVYLAQCASGVGWKSKLHTPEMAVWEKLIDWKHPPGKAFALPFALLDDEFTRRCNQVKGLLLDRYRILSPCQNDPDWVSKPLADSIVEWMKPRVDWLLGINSE